MSIIPPKLSLVARLRSQLAQHALHHENYSVRCNICFSSWSGVDNEKHHDGCVLGEALTVVREEICPTETPKTCTCRGDLRGWNHLSTCPKYRGDVDDALAAATEIGDCGFTERESAISALRQICDLSEHDSPVYCIAAEEWASLAHEQRQQSEMPPRVRSSCDRLSANVVVARVRRDLNADVRIEEVHAPGQDGQRWYLVVSHSTDPTASISVSDYTHDQLEHMLGNISRAAYFDRSKVLGELLRKERSQGQSEETSFLTEIVQAAGKQIGERDAKLKTLQKLVEAARQVAALQPAAYAKNPDESERWATFYSALNTAEAEGKNHE